jgi:RNA polymerase sigma factor (TIGR02999 family)
VAHPVNERVAAEEDAQADSHSHATLDRLMPVLYDELRDAARRQLALGPDGGTLSATGLVHEAYLKIAKQTNLYWRDRAHFMALASLAMRHVLVDRAKARLRHKREGSARPVTLDEQLIADAQQPEALLQISDALERLAAEDPRLARIVDCRFFGGFSEPEIADALGVTVRTVQRDWVKARALLRRALEGEGDGEEVQ